MMSKNQIAENNAAGTAETRKHTPLPPDDPEILACDAIFASIQRFISRMDGYWVDTTLLKRAYATAKELHGDQRRASGILYLNHPLAVAESLAHLTCKTEVLAAGLLHDTIEDCGYTYEELKSEFGEEIAEIVNSVTEIKAVEKKDNALFREMTEQEQHDYLDKLTDEKLIKSKYQRESFLVRLADREHNLSTIDAVAPEKRRLKIAQTRTRLIPAAGYFGMKYYETVLRDLCMKYSEDPVEYDTVQTCRHQYVSVSGDAFSEFDTIFQRALGKQEVFALPRYNPFARFRGEQLEMRRSLRAVELLDQIEDGFFFTRHEICLNEVLLTIRENDWGKAVSEFIRFYKKNLKQHAMYFELGENHGNAQDITLTDRYENNYRIVIVQEDKLEEYFLGSGRKMIQDPVPPPGRGEMTVYAYSTYKGVRKFEQVPNDATALDFAFMVSPAMAVTAKAARLKKWMGGEVTFDDKDYLYPLKTPLEDGDVVNFDADYSPNEKAIIPHATIDWFDYINTASARQQLIRYFNTNGPKRGTLI